MTPKLLYRIVAVAETITWALLLVAMACKYLLHAAEWLVPIAGGLHGFVFLSYCAATVFVWINERWGVGRGLLGLGSSILPFATIPFERSLERHEALGTTWRLGAGGEPPRGFVEHVQAWVLRHPLVAFILVVVAISVVFTVLLRLGPPQING